MGKRRLGEIVGLNFPVLEGPWEFDDDDFALMAMLQDPIYCAELLVSDAKNHDYAGQYRVLRQQVKFFDYAIEQIQLLAQRRLARCRESLQEILDHCA